MRRISVVLDDVTEKALCQIINLNKCTISDAVAMGVLILAQEPINVMKILPDPMEPIIKALETHRPGMSLDNWCDCHNINKYRLYYLVKRCHNGSTVWGFGNTKNKWRDKQDERRFKTHTSWIAHCLKEDLGIDLT